MTTLSAYPQEQLLIDFLPHLTGKRIFCTSLGRAQFAHAAAKQPGVQVACHFLDLYRAKLVENVPENSLILCSADFPEQEFDLVAFPLSATGDAELTQEMLQEGHKRLILHGQMVVTTNNPRDTWLKEQMEKLFEKVEQRRSEQGVLYVANKTEPLKKTKDFSSEFAFRDHGRLLKACSRPGVFSHRHIDVGARRLIDAMEIKAGDRVLDVGCGWGAVALAAAVRVDNVRVHAIDSNARAITCTEKSAQLNNLTNITTGLTASGELDEPGSYDVVLANPPYYANFEIAKLFALTGQRALKPGGKILFVAKRSRWYAEHLPQWFDSVQIQPVKGYVVVSAQAKTL